MVLLPLTGGVPGFTSIPLPNSFRSMSICKTEEFKPLCWGKTETPPPPSTQSACRYLAGGWLHHAVVWTHDPPVRLGHGGLSTERGGLGLWRSRGQRQEWLAAPGAEVWQGELGAGQGDSHLEGTETHKDRMKIQRRKTCCGRRGFKEGVQRYLLHCRTGRLSVAIVTTLTVLLLHLPRIHI